jgi:protein-S-isoprenylcysteine O-methyltransferase Ste14
MDLLWLALGWIAYAALHSLLAALAVKTWVTRRWPDFAPYYRLAFNALAVILVLPLAWATFALPGDWLWRWTGPAAWLANGLTLAALAGFWFSAGSYDMGEFLGLRQLRERSEEIDRRDRFVISPCHRFVRHPWYFFGLVLVWTRDMNPPWLVSALAITLYCAIGSYFEESKLLVLHGDRYRRYRARVPALFPLPWKFLGPAEAENL